MTTTNTQIIEILKTEDCLFFKENEMPDTFILEMEKAEGNGSVSGYYGVTMFNNGDFVSGFIINRDTKEVTLQTTDINYYKDELYM